MTNMFGDLSTKGLRNAVAGLRDKHMETWVPGYVRYLAHRARTPRYEGTRHLLFAFCDHYEPLWGSTDVVRGAARVKAWEEGYPKLAAAFRDADGRPPRHSFFFPGEEYTPGFLDALAKLARAGLGEVELHLHHDGDTRENLRTKISSYLKIFASHGHLSRDVDGRVRYGFIHGNWALANGRPDGRQCGVDDELPLLFDTGCYADFTFPAAPDLAQPNIVNQIYWPTGDLNRARCYENGQCAQVGEVRNDRILMIEGPLGLAYRPGARNPIRIENGAVTGVDPGTPDRVRSWARQNIHIEGRPEWVFVKVHTHGAPEKQGASLLGEGGRVMHQELTTRFNDGKRWVLHYVTAREMYNIAWAAMEGHSGDPNLFRDHRLPRPPVSAG